MKSIFTLVTIFLLSGALLKAELTVTSDFEGGSGLISEIDNGKQFIRLNPENYPGKANPSRV